MHGSGVMDDHVSGFGVEAQQVAAFGRSVQGFTLGAGDRPIVDEEVRPVVTLPTVGAPRVFDRSALARHRVERGPGGAELLAAKVEVARVLMEVGRLARAG